MPVVCVRLNDEALAALDNQASSEGMDRSAWLRAVLLLHLDGAGVVDDVSPPPAATLDVRVPGDTIDLLDPDNSLPAGAVRP